jgi:hypothetical protein
MVVLPRRLRACGEPARRAVFALTGYEIVQYALWATADVVILWAKSDAGFAIRLVPNLMYYAFFVPFALVVLKKSDA